MDNASRETDRTIAVLSPNYLSALYTQPEWAAAFAEDPTGEKRNLLPVSASGNASPMGRWAENSALKTCSHIDTTPSNCINLRKAPSKNRVIFRY